MTHPYFHPTTKKQLAWAGHTPGLPWAFQYVEVPVHPTYVNPEYLPVWPPDSAGVRQNRYNKPIIGDFQSMVYDVPFDSTAPFHPNPPKIQPMWFMDY